MADDWANVSLGIPAFTVIQTLQKYFMKNACNYEPYLLGLFCIRKTTFTLVKLRKNIRT